VCETSDFVIFVGLFNSANDLLIDVVKNLISYSEDKDSRQKVIEWR
jgi:hypothetical protein